jgi:hypothetical protein
VPASESASAPAFDSNFDSESLAESISVVDFASGSNNASYSDFDFGFDSDSDSNSESIVEPMVKLRLQLRL